MSTGIEIKPHIDHIDHDEDDVKRPEDHLTAYNDVSKHHNLGFARTIWTFRKAMTICVGVALCAMGDGYQFKMPGNIVALRGFINQMGYPGPTGTYVLNSQHVATWGGVYSGAQILVLVCGSWPLDHLGRKPMLIMTQVFMLIACLIEMFATNWTHWLAAKIMNGLSVGCNQMAATTYLSEIAPTQVRGAALGLYQLAWAIGSFAAAVGLQVVSSTLPPEQWRHAVYSMWVFLGIAFLVLIWVPESPRFYAIRGKHEIAKKKMQKIYGGIEGYDIEYEYNIILKEIEDGKALTKKQSDANLLDCFRGTNLRRTIISVTPFTYQLWIGSPVVFSYTSYFFQLAGLAQPFIATVAVNTVLVISVATSLYTTERFGRRPLLIYLGALMVPLLFSIGGILKISPQTSATGSAMIALACIWVAAYASSAGPLGFVFLAECSTVILRAKTANMAALGTSLFGLITNYCVPLMLASPNFGVSSTMFFFGSTGAASVVFLYFIIPETKNRSFVELDEMFELKVSSRRFASFETSVDRAKKMHAEETV